MIEHHHQAESTVEVRRLAGFDDPSFGPEQWQELLRSAETDCIFLTRQWLRTWWEFFGKGELLLMVAERSGQVVALAPLYTDERMIYFVGSGGSDYLDFIGDIGDPAVLDALLDSARAAVPGFLGFEFFMVLDNSLTGRRLEEAAARLGLECCAQDDLGAPELDLTCRPEVALAATKKKRLVRLENFFRREGVLVIRSFRDADSILLQLDEFFAQHISRWEGTHAPSLFLEPAQRAFYRRWTEVGAQAGWLRFTRLEWNSHPIAFHFGLCYRRRYFWYKPSFAIELARRSPGQVLLRQSILAAIDEGSAVLDFGIGEEPYKYRFATASKRIRTWGLYPARAAAQEIEYGSSHS